MDISLIRRRLDHIRFYTGTISQRRDGDCRKYIQIRTINFLFARRYRLEYGESWSQAQMQPRRFRIAIDVRLFVGGREGDSRVPFTKRVIRFETMLFLPQRAGPGGFL